ncbi:methyltransferase domain-containing protein [Svornostia abyssi]|uniref:Methyltransferase domain-containing protein n=1 Tax=Svornostia abyssi TaxID=2898438 RepID=A0ABY5PIG5_9ACTN|nr:methyltransferase domain-containing protein [Parviterribacteraceae bacterium J379]
MSDALAAVADRLRCPHCGSAMTCDDRTVACAEGHRFDRARGGGVTLLGPGAELPPGDTDAMLAARDAFLGAGHYAPLTDAIAAACPAVDRACLVDVGAGTGHHTAGVLDARPGWTGIALDASRAATRRAARAHPRLAAIACDATAPLPVRDGGADVLLSVFSPRNAVEFARVLAPAGVLVVASATEDHLAEAVGPLGLIGVQPQKRARLHERLAPDLVSVALRRVRIPLALDHAALEQLAGMGPTAFHATPEEIAARVAAVPEPFTVTAVVTVETFARAP